MHLQLTDVEQVQLKFLHHYVDYGVLSLVAFDLARV